LEFSGKARENLDIYHALEYLSNKRDALYDKGMAEHILQLFKNEEEDSRKDTQQKKIPLW